jgi:hypothetical protein
MVLTSIAMHVKGLSKRPCMGDFERFFSNITTIQKFCSLSLLSCKFLRIKVIGGILPPTFIMFDFLEKRLF